jgi:tungstate transport system substrate-binding protein
MPQILCLAIAFLSTAAFAHTGLAVANSTLVAASSTSIANSELASDHFPAFGRETGFKLKLVPVGSARAVGDGRQGRSDVVLTRAPDAKREFVANGNGVARQPVIYNGFVLLGPADKPAVVGSLKDAGQAFRSIWARQNRLFAARRDEFGTYRKEPEVRRRGQYKFDGQRFLTPGSMKLKCWFRRRQ